MPFWAVGDQDIFSLWRRDVFGSHQRGSGPLASSWIEAFCMLLRPSSFSLQLTFFLTCHGDLKISACPSSAPKLQWLPTSSGTTPQLFTTEFWEIHYFQKRIPVLKPHPPSSDAIEVPAPETEAPSSPSSVFS